MSLQAVNEFRIRLNSDPALQSKFREALPSGNTAIVALGAANGFVFTESETAEALEKFSLEQEPSDFELELVSAGSACQGSNT